MVNFNATDIPPLDGKVILVTGGNAGIGKQCILEYARHNPAELWLAARSPSKTQAAIDEINQRLPAPVRIKVLEVDLSSLNSVKKAAETFTAQVDRLDILMLNAGIMASAPGLTKDGYEEQFGVNYLGHALLAKLLLPLLNKTSQVPNADVRAIMITSLGHNLAPKGGIPFDKLKTECAHLGPFERYGCSKLANILWAKHAAAVYPQITFASAHPGLVGGTNLGASSTGAGLFHRALMALSPLLATSLEKGARSQLWTSVAQQVVSGEYYEPVGLAGRGSVMAKDGELAKRLWDWTEEELRTFVV